MYPVSFVLKFEFVDLSQEGIQKSINPCDRIFKNKSGKFYSPKITFLYGRGGQRHLKCSYTFEYSNTDLDEYQFLSITFTKASFGNKKCTTIYDPEVHKYSCKDNNNDEGSAKIIISEYPWKGIEIQRGCICQNITNPIKISTSTAEKVVVSFLVDGMSVNDDYRNYFFDANYELNKQYTGMKNYCPNQWKNRKLKG